MTSCGTPVPIGKPSKRISSNNRIPQGARRHCVSDRSFRSAGMDGFKNTNKCLVDVVPIPGMGVMQQGGGLPEALQSGQQQLLRKGTFRRCPVETTKWKCSDLFPLKTIEKPRYSRRPSLIPGSVRRRANLRNPRHRPGSGSRPGFPRIEPGLRQSNSIVTIKKPILVALSLGLGASSTRKPGAPVSGRDQQAICKERRGNRR